MIERERRESFVYFHKTREILHKGMSKNEECLHIQSLYVLFLKICIEKALQLQNISLTSDCIILPLIKENDIALFYENLYTSLTNVDIHLCKLHI